jgi:hypothetical protein
MATRRLATSAEAVTRLAARRGVRGRRSIETSELVECFERIKTFPQDGRCARVVPASTGSGEPRPHLSVSGHETS